MRVEHRIGVHQREPEPAAFQREGAGAIGAGPGAQHGQLIAGAGQQLEMPIASGAGLDHTRAIAQLARGRPHHGHQRVHQRHRIGRAHTRARVHTGAVHFHLARVLGAGEMPHDRLRLETLFVAAFALEPGGQCGAFMTELAEPAKGFLRLLECAPAIAFVHESIVEQQAHVTVSDANRCPHLVREHMQDVADINRHANAEPTTHLQHAWHGTCSAESEWRTCRQVKVKRILLVDDYPDALEIWGLFLRSLGYQVLTAADGLTAVEMAAAEHPDIIVLDLELPGITGFEAAARLRQTPLTREIPLIAATGYSHLAQLQQARTVGFDSIVVKPCEPSALVTEIERLLTRRRQARPRSKVPVKRFGQNR